MPTTWKTDCAVSCGNELLRFDPGYAYQDDGTAYPPACDRTGLPDGAVIADDVPGGTPSIRPNCPNTAWSDNGTFTFSWPTDSTGKYPGKIDTHQLGIGFGGHLWMTNARNLATDPLLRVTGTWKFNSSFRGTARIWVSLPPVAAGDARTAYQVRTKYGWRTSRVQQKSTGTGNRWVPIGMYEFDNAPEVELSNVATNGDGTQRVAFDAVAYEPIYNQPTVKVLHWNLAGAAKNRGDYDVVDSLLAEVLAKRPDVVTTNEICDNQFDNLRGRLVQAGYRLDGDFFVTKLSTCQNAGDIRFDAGNAVLVRGDVVRTDKYAFDENDELSVDYPLPDLDDRVVGCVTARITGTTKDTKVCTTHLAQEEDGASVPWWEADAQTREIARYFASETRRKPFMITGDFNIPTPPRNEGLATLYGDAAGTGDFHEAWEERECVTTNPCSVSQGGPATNHNGVKGDRKIDYIFADRYNFFVPVGRVSTNQNVGTCQQGNGPAPCSDHYSSSAEFVMPR
jgi:endonuclease/exonuclease/phosphatase family metal-dependent hydrolase